MTAVRLLAGLLGVAVVLGAASSVVRTLVVPRSLRSKLTEVVHTATRAPLRRLADATDALEAKDRILAWAGPMSILASLATWLVTFLLGYALLLFAFSDLGWRLAIREAGSSLLTLGFASTDRVRLTGVDFLAAATGPVVIGLLVGYLPALYAAYNRRETEVTLLESRAGEPPWGPEILARHAQVGITANLGELYRGWERWSADVSESHTSYPVLIHFRSPRPRRDWLVGLLAVLDSAALHLAFNPTTADGDVRVCLRAGFVCLREIARTERIPFDPDPSPDDDIELSYQDFLGAVERMAQAGYSMERTPEQAWPHFRGWRINYESIAYELASRIDAVPAPWSGERRRAMKPTTIRSPVDRKPTR